MYGSIRKFQRTISFNMQILYYNYNLLIIKNLQFLFFLIITYEKVMSVQEKKSSVLHK